jgi:hypothetical protein
MNKCLPRTLLILTGLALSSAVLVSPLAGQQRDQGSYGAREQRRPMMPLDLQANQQLHQTYDDLGMVNVWLSCNQAKPPLDLAPLLDQAMQYYRQARQAFDGRQYGRALELAVAADLATHGMLSTLHASTPAPEGLPAPPQVTGSEEQGGQTGQHPERRPEPNRGSEAPRGDQRAQGGAGGQPEAPQSPMDAARQTLDFVHQRINEASRGESGREPAKAFLDASRKLYDESRQAYQKRDYDRAIELAMGAGAWTQVGEHLLRAQNPQRYGSAPPPGSGAGQSHDQGGQLPPPQRRDRPPTSPPSDR